MSHGALASVACVRRVALLFPRSSGLLLHPTSLPGRYGVGDLGDGARAFVDFLAAARQGLWQVLPLGPTGFGDSPYQSFSAFAGNPVLISLDQLREDGWLSAADLADPPACPADQVDYGTVIPYKRDRLERAAQRFLAAGGGAQAADFDAFRAAHAAWLEDFALFMGLKDAHDGAVWNTWEAPLARREAAALTRWRERLRGAADGHAVRQFFFFRQWLALKAYANQRGVRLVGDTPIFAAYDSADVWSHPELFFLNARGNPTVVAGVPPDYFSATGQLWGNPLYRWDGMAAQRYGWWIDRLRLAFQLVDVLRIDHFIGFARYWEIPARAKTAVKGRWVPGPGAALGLAAREALGELPIIAEDLGAMTPEVDALRDQLGLPGMRVLQFAFDTDASNRFLPHNHTPNSVVYTGTHDNDTSVGWFAAAGPTERSNAQHYLARSGEDIAWDLIRAALASVAHTAIIPVQDVLSLGSAARMNLPGRPHGNWSWRLLDGALGPALAERLGSMTEWYGRTPAAAAGEDV
ncbi:MAG: 4-alpha-glucanotransferase [Candidatus Binatia bacterium]